MVLLMGDRVDPSADCVPFVPKGLPKEKEEHSKCPRCGADCLWQLQDRYRLGGVVFSERILVCNFSCWYGPVALFPWDGFEDKAKMLGAL